MEFKDWYNQSLAAYDERGSFTDRQKLFEGDKSLGYGKKSAMIVYNMTQELIESQIDSSIPQPKVKPQRPTEKTIRNAAIIEDMLRNQSDRLPFELMNDEDERTVKIMGGSMFLVEWDNTVKTHDTVGDISVRLINAKQFIPQQAVYETRYMDYLFLTFDDTKSRIKKRYKKDVTSETIDPQVSDSTTTTDDVVTQVVCYYINSDGGLGCFSWAGDTVLIDDDDFEARKDKVCAKCGESQPIGEKVCSCGSDEWVKRPKDYEIILDDVVRADGTVIPAMSPEIDENGNPVMEDYQEQAVDPMTGYPLFNRIIDDMGNIVGAEPQLVTRQKVKLSPTQIPYYYPHQYPLIVRKNISATNRVIGYSDCDLIKDHQHEINKLLSKIEKKLLKAGSYLTKPVDLRFEFSDEDVVPINIENPAQANMLNAIDLKFDISQDWLMVQNHYEMAKSVLGVTDSFQGKPDSTAVSGTAKQAQIAQAAGRQRSKRVMKYAAYAELYEMMFKFMLAYADEPRTYTSTNEQGEQVQQVFSRYDFMEQDDAGNWYYDDQYLFSVDESGIDSNNKQWVLEDLRTDLGLGAYGDPNDPETMLAYWKEKEIAGYPGAKRNVARWESKVQQQSMIQAQLAQQSIINQGGTQNEMPIMQ